MQEKLAKNFWWKVVWSIPSNLSLLSHNIKTDVYQWWLYHKFISHLYANVLSIRHWTTSVRNVQNLTWMMATNYAYHACYYIERCLILATSARITAVICLLFVCYHATAIPHLYVKNESSYGIFQICNVWLSLEMLCSKVLVPFAHHCCLPNKYFIFETTVASFQRKE